MRSQLVFSALILAVAALEACSAQSDSTTPRNSSAAGSTSSTGATGAGGSSNTGSAGTSTNTGFGGSTAIAGSTSTSAGGTPSGFGGAPPAAGGSTTTSGGSSTSTGTCATTKVGTGSDGMIDNFDTHPMNGLIPATDGRVGGWWISKSATAMVMPAAGAAPNPVADGTNYALHFSGTDPGTDPNAAWGADASVAITGTNGCYDASIYTGGVKVSLKGTGSVYVSVITAEDKAASATSGNQRKEIPLMATWTDVTIPWTDLVTGWGNPIPLDQKEIVALDIAPSATSAANFDIWVDNLQFVK